MAKAPGSPSKHARDRARDVGYGWNSGLLFQPTSRTRIGFTYRSNVEFQLEGDPDLRNVPANTFNQRFKADLNLPARYSLSAYQELGSGFAVVGDVTYTQWSSFDQIEVGYILFELVAPDSALFRRMRVRSRWQEILSFF